jgi:hypothetical protein
MGKRFLHNDSCFWFSNYWFGINRFDNDEFREKEVIKSKKKRGCLVVILFLFIHNLEI